MVLQDNTVTEINKKGPVWGPGETKNIQSLCLEQDGLTTLLRSVSILLSHLFSQCVIQEKYILLFIQIQSRFISVFLMENKK